MAMVCGAETTPEEDFLYSQEMSDFMHEWEGYFISRFCLEPIGNHSFSLSLGDFAWALKQKIDEEGL